MNTPIALLASVIILPAAGQDAVTSSITGNIFRPAVLEPTAERIAKLHLRSGFKLTVFAQGLEAPRMMAVADGGRLYVTRRG
jgi:glucose/arabinose dehydrogenase